MKLRYLFLGLLALGATYLFFLEERGGSPGANAALLEGADHAIAAAGRVATRLGGVARLDAARHGLGLSREIIRELAELNPEAEESEDNGVAQGKVEKGATLADVLEDASKGGASHYVQAAAKVFPLASLRAGQPYTVFTDPVTGHLQRFEYEVNEKSRLVVEGHENPQARIEEIHYATLLATCEGVIDDSLFQAVADIGESPQLAARLVDLFSTEVNFIRNIKSGDSFSVLIEKRFKDGEFRSYGRILAARFTNRGKTYEAWLYRDPLGDLRYYNSKGESLEKTLLMSPLAVTRLTSRFTHSRRHPILGGARPHLGVDYAAPIGTPVKAVGSGVVSKRGWAGGYGNQIIVRHASGLESMYSHLSGYARGLREGQKVRQGQVIGFVGSTGLSTGPHLDFRLRQKGEFINPAQVINPRGAAVDDALMSNFKKVRDKEKAYLEGAKLPDKYALDSIVPESVTLPKTPAVRSRQMVRLDKMRQATRMERIKLSKKLASALRKRR